MRRHEEDQEIHNSNTSETMFNKEQKRLRQEAYENLKKAIRYHSQSSESDDLSIGATSRNSAVGGPRFVTENFK